MPVTVQNALDVLDQLPLAERQYVLDIERQRIIEERRKVILRISSEAEAEYRRGELTNYSDAKSLLDALAE